MTKAPRAVAREALRRARETLPAYSSKGRRKVPTPRPLFAILAVKTFLKTDYRAVIASLADSAELRDDLGLTDGPDHPAPWYAEQRRLRRGTSSSSPRGPPRPQPTAA